MILTETRQSFLDLLKKRYLEVNTSSHYVADKIVHFFLHTRDLYRLLCDYTK
ncbi:hypothetical protein IH779_01090 [Patescibacteria group bacterium]|nr:hypothetical protein [Patescibacteria group bacterium]